MSDVTLNVKAFHRRAKQLWQAFRSANEEKQAFFAEANAVLIAVGKADEENVYRKSIALQTWLLGYEFPDTVMAITEKEGFLFLTGKKKADIIEQLNRNAGGIKDAVPVKTIQRGKDPELNKTAYAQLFDAIKGSYTGAKVGVLTKDKQMGDFYTDFITHQNDAKTWEEVDVAAPLAMLLSRKDEEEMKTISAAAKCSALIMGNYFVDQMTEILDEDRKVTHAALSRKVDEALYNPKDRKSWRFSSLDVDEEYLDWCYPPIIQSNGQYDLKPSAMSDEQHLSSGVIISSLGVRYKSYCSNITRTYMIDPSKEKEKAMTILIDCHAHIIRKMVPGITLSQLYNEATQFLAKSDMPTLQSHFYKNMGFLTGIEFRESSYVVTTKSDRKIEANQVYNLLIGVTDVVDSTESNGQKYALAISDTVRVQDGSQPATVLTDAATKTLNDISFFMKTEEQEKEERKREEALRKKEAARSSVILTTKLRHETSEVDASKAQKRQEHQKALFDALQRDGMDRYGEDDAIQQKQKKAVFRKFESYKPGSAMPPEAGDLKIFVDKRAETVILPIYGRPVPFHIVTIKNIAKGTEGEFTTLRFNFNAPGQAGAKKDDIVPFDDPNAHFVRAMTFRSTDGFRMGDLYKTINDLKKSVSQRDAQRKEMADLVEQDRLQTLTGRRPMRLPDVYMRPPPEGRKGAGEVEIHENGIRFTNVRGSDARVDVLFSNIKHLIFQPSEGELFVTIHVHLKTPIMIGKKKALDLQFVRESVEGANDETSNRRRRQLHGDTDEIQQEQEDRKRRRALDKEFKNFAEEISKASKFVEVDVPYRNLSFTGVPFRNNVLLQPTTECLMAISEAPFFVVTLADIELAHLERVQFGLKNFDLVFVFKDLQKPVAQVNSIPMKQLEDVKDWLDGMNIAFTEGPVNLNWSQIMKTVNEDPAGFFDEGGWGFLGDGGSDNDSQESDEQESEFEVESDESAFESEESEDDYESEHTEESDFESGDDSSDEGEDWDEMEAKAARADRQKHGGEEEDSRGASRKKASKRDASEDEDSDDHRPKKKKSKR